MPPSLYGGSLSCTYTDMNETVKAPLKIKFKECFLGNSKRRALFLHFHTKNFIRSGGHDNLFGRRQFIFSNWLLGVGLMPTEAPCQVFAPHRNRLYWTLNVKGTARRQNNSTTVIILISVGSHILSFRLGSCR